MPFRMSLAEVRLSLDHESVYVPSLLLRVGRQVCSAVVLQAFARGISGRRVSTMKRKHQKLQVCLGLNDWRGEAARPLHDSARLGCVLDLPFRMFLDKVRLSLDHESVYVPSLLFRVGRQVCSAVVLQAFARGISGRRVSTMKREHQKLQVCLGLND